MARENTVYLYGWVMQSPMIYVNHDTGEITSGQITLMTLRRSYANKELMLKGAVRMDTPCVFSRNAYFINHNMVNIERGDMVLVKGTLCTQEVSKQYVCPYCGHENIKTEAVVVYIDPVHMMVLERGLDKDTGFKRLQNNDEISNQLYLYGTLCREPQYYTNEETHKKECQFQVASNRKRRIEEDGPLKRTDYPWVKAFGSLAEECMNSLHTNSSIYINGAIETREITQKLTCEDCGQVFERKGLSMEIVPYSIEYLRNCNIPESQLAEDGEYEEEPYEKSAEEQQTC